MSLPSELTRAAAARGGVITRTLVLGHGSSGREIATWIADGHLRVLWRGILTVNPEPQDATSRHRELAHAISVAYAGRLAVSHHSAIVLAGLPTYDVDLDTVRLVRRNGGSSLSTPGIRVSRCSVALPVTEVDGALMVQEAIAIAQLARDVGLEAAVVAADAALHRASITGAQLAAAVELLERVRGSARARQLPGLVDARSESPGESLLRLIAVRAGIVLEPQYIVRDARGDFVARCDFRVAGTRTLVEFDGRMKYDDRSVLFAEKRREDELRGLGWQVVRVVWADLGQPAQIIRRVRGARS